MLINKIIVYPLVCNRIADNALKNGITYDASVIICLPDKTEIKVPKQGGEFILSSPLNDDQVGQLSAKLYMYDRQPNTFASGFYVSFPHKYTNNVTRPNEPTTLKIEFCQGYPATCFSPNVTLTNSTPVTTVVKPINNIVIKPIMVPQISEQLKKMGINEDASAILILPNKVEISVPKEGLTHKLDTPIDEDDISLLVVKVNMLDRHVGNLQEAYYPVCGEKPNSEKVNKPLFGLFTWLLGSNSKSPTLTIELKRGWTGNCMFMETQLN